MSNCSYRLPDSLATDHGDDFNFQLPKKCLMFDGLQEDYQAAAIEANESDGTRDKGPSNREGRKEKKEEKATVTIGTRSKVELLDDGYKWRKYGKKVTGGGQNERNYYKCSAIGCPARKWVERDREDPTHVITTYQGDHKHNISSQCLMFPQETRTGAAMNSSLADYTQQPEGLFQFEPQDGDGKVETTVKVQGMAKASQQSNESGLTNQSDHEPVLTLDKGLREKRCQRVHRAPTTVIYADPSNFRNVVQELTGLLPPRLPQFVSDRPEKRGILADIKTEYELPFSVERYTMSSKQGAEVLTEIPKGDKWIAPKICATVCKPVLPESPNCPFLVALSLEGSKALMAIPSSFFEHMPVLTHLNLSHTSIMSLPVSLFKLVSLKELSLRHCKLFMELSPQVGQLHNLVLLDLDETQIAKLPKEIGKLSNLKILRLSLDGYMNCGKQLQQNVLIHPGTINRLSQLMELKIDVNPDNEDSNAVEEIIVEEACSLKRLKCLMLYLANVQILGKRRTGSTSLSYYPLCRFRFTVGQHRQRIISRVPKKVEAHFQEWDKCLKFVKVNDISSEMKRVIGYTKAFYLERHASARSLCDFGIKNIKNLEFCLLAECNEIQTIIDDEKPYEQEQIDIVEDEVINCESGGEAFSAQEHVLTNLQYMHIYYLKNLVSIWRNATCDKQCLFGLKVLEIHVCPKLEVIFSPALLNNLGKLEVLIVEDCPELTTVVSPTSNVSFRSRPDCFLPSLKMMLLLFLPKLESISSEFHIAPKLEKIGFYDCPELKGLSRRELSSENLEVIKGENDWWEALKWDESEGGKEFLEPFMESNESESEWTQWRNPPVCLQNIFSPIDEDDDVMTQMEEMYKSIDPKNKNEIPNPGLGLIP